MRTEHLATELQRLGVGRTSDTRRTLRRHSRDFGGIASATPALVARPTTSDEISTCLRFAAQHDLVVATRGSGHSSGGQTLREGGLVLRLPDRAPRLLGPDRVEISAGSTWRHVESVLQPEGRTIPVLADYLGLSVGGTLSVGCYGVDSIAHGAQVHHVERLLLVRPDGTQLWCSLQEHRDLFRFALAGLGQVGVIDRVIVRTVAHDPWVTLFTYRYDSLMEMLDSWQWMKESGGALPVWFKASYSHRRCYSVFGIPAQTSRQALSAAPPQALADRRCHRLVSRDYRRWRSLAVQAWLALYPRRRRLWSDYLFDWRGLQDFAQHLQQVLQESRYARLMACAYMLAVRAPVDAPTFPFEASGNAAGQLRFGVGVYAMVPSGDAPALAAWRELSRRNLRACVALGGRPYLYGWHEPEEHQLETLYGHNRQELLKSNRLTDPGGRFLSHVLFPNHERVR